MILQKIFPIALVSTLQLFGESVHTQLIENYSSNYCLSLEEAYGDGMMSEGGTKAIENMFQGISLSKKNMLDIGSGLGGMSFFLSQQYDAEVTGVEINPWMVEESTKRAVGIAKVNFVLIHEDNLLPFQDQSFDIVYSKGVLTHVQNKKILFEEIFRVLKPGGLFIIEDWLSPVFGTWGDLLRKMAESEGLILFAETEESYVQLLKETGFSDISMRSESENYARYNREIALRITESNTFKEKFGEQVLAESAAGYHMIADSIENGELLIRHFKATK